MTQKKLIEKELSDAVLAIGEALQQLDERLFGVETDLFVVKGFLASVMNPVNPAEALASIETRLKEARAKAPGAGRRVSIAQQIEMLKLIEKHGPPRES